MSESVSDHVAGRECAFYLGRGEVRGVAAPFIHISNPLWAIVRFWEGYPQPSEAGAGLGDQPC